MLVMYSDESSTRLCRRPGVDPAAAKFIAAFITSLTFCARLLCAQDPLTTLPDNYHLVFENQFVRVLHVTYQPHQKLPVHNHPATPTLYVYLTDSGPVRFSHIEERPFSATRQPLKAGAFRLSPGRLEKHEVENLGDIPSEFLRVELQKVPLGFQRKDFRDYKSFDLTQSSTSTEFAGPFITIQRIIAAPHQTIETEKPNEPSLLIALSATSALRPGEVLWVGPHPGYRLAGAGSMAANVLRVIFLSP